MIELVDDRPRHVLERDEVDDVVVRVQVSLNLDGRPVVVAVQPLAVVAVIRDEVSRTEHQVILGDADLVARGGHGLETPGVAVWLNRSPGRAIGRLTPQGPDQLAGPAGRGSELSHLEGAANKAAVTRSAVVPGFSRFPRARSQASKRFAASLWLSGSSGQPAARTSAALRVTSRAVSSPPLRTISESGWRASMLRNAVMIAVSSGLAVAERGAEHGKCLVQDLPEAVGILPCDQVAIGRQGHRLAQGHRRFVRDVLIGHLPRPPGAPAGSPGRRAGRRPRSWRPERAPRPRQGRPRAGPPRAEPAARSSPGSCSC